MWDTQSEEASELKSKGSPRERGQRKQSLCGCGRILRISSVTGGGKEEPAREEEKGPE